MRRRLTTALASAGPLAALACSDGNPSATPTDAGLVDVLSADVADAGQQGPPPVTEFSIVREPDTGCTASTTAQPVVIRGGPALTALEMVGSRRVTRTLTGDGFILFDATGANASATPVAVGSGTHAAGSETSVLAAGVSSSKVVVARFDPSGAPLDATQVLGDARPGPEVAVGRSGDKWLVAWAATRSEVRARAIDAAGQLGPDIVLETGADHSDFTAAVARSTAGDGSDFLVVWAVRREALFAYRVYAALVSSERMVGLPRLLFGSDTRVRIVKLVTDDSGAALLANLDGEPLVAPLDKIGRLTGAAHVFEGARETLVGGGHGLAVKDRGLALVADHLSGAHVFRALDRRGRPSAGWVCLDAPQGGAFQLGSIIADGAGWSVVIATPAGSALLRVDASATNPL